MQRWLLRLGVVSLFGVGAAIGCAASGNNNTVNGNAGGAGGGSGSTGGSSAASLTTSSTVTGVSVGSVGSGGGSSCAKFTDAATQAPAALLFVQDMSASMTTNGKWSASQLAIVQAIDEDVFDSMSLGIVTFPSSFAEPPSCLCQGLDQQTCDSLLAPGVSCGTSALPQVAIAPAGMNKSNAGMGVRSDIYNYLANHDPLSNADDGAPIYDALVSGYNALKAYNIDKRILVLVTDGGFSCTSLSAPQRPAYIDGIGCPDWEEPVTVNALITAARTDPTKPIDTFIVGVPGSNSTGKPQGPYDTAPYSMRLALSTYAVSGSPTTVDPACNSNATSRRPRPIRRCPAISISRKAHSTRPRSRRRSLRSAARRSAAPTICRRRRPGRRSIPPR